RPSGFRTVFRAVLLVGVLIGISYAFTLPALFDKETWKMPWSTLRASLSTTAGHASALVAKALPLSAAVPVQANIAAPPSPTQPSAYLLPDEEAASTLPLLVNREHILEEGYRPSDLVRMRDYCSTSLVTIKGREIEGQREAVDALMVMLEDAHADGLTVWQVSAGYRSVKYQRTLFDKKVQAYVDDGMNRSRAKSAAKKTVAEPGSSEHHTGLAFDITVPGQSFKLTPQADWIRENCWKYGFILRYTED
ncbi:MAG: M15 family metallopeptidase, partial [Clostridia bacterium]